MRCRWSGVRRAQGRPRHALHPRRISSDSFAPLLRHPVLFEHGLIRCPITKEVVPCP